MLATLDTCAWMNAGQPVVLLGDSGTGKSHIPICLGCLPESGRRVRYATTAGELVLVPGVAPDLASSGQRRSARRAV